MEAILVVYACGIFTGIGMSILYKLYRGIG